MEMQMSVLKRVLPAAFAFAFATSGAFGAAEYPADNEPDSKDIEFLRNWFKTKRAVSIEEKGGQLSMSGSVRTEMNNQSGQADIVTNAGTDTAFLPEYYNGVRQYGSDNSTASTNFKNRVDLFFDYRTPHTWASIKLKFSNRMGALGAQTNKIDLEKGLVGYRVFDNGKAAVIDIEAGRTKLYNFFDSKTQFNSLLDGFSLRFADSIEQVFDLDMRGAMAVVDPTNNQYAYFGEVDFMDIGEVGIFFKYAYSHWRKRGLSAVWQTNNDKFDRYGNEKARDNPQFRFQISQFLLGYDMDPEVLRFPFKIYGAFSMNHSARNTTIAYNNTPNGDTPHLESYVLPKSQRYAWYAGVTAGKVVKRGDWSVEVVYQSVDAQAIPDYDVAGIGTGNPYGYNIYRQATGTVAGSAGLPVYTGPAGNGNYRGWTVDAMFAITNNISLLLEFDYSKEKKSLRSLTSEQTTPNQEYKRFGVNAIYAF
jgi:hypothetical protein